MKILVTGSSGFIGYHLCLNLLSSGYDVVGVDNNNTYYDIKLKLSRLNELKKHSNFKFYKIDISNKKKMLKLFSNNTFDCVVNLAAQAGVRYSITNPDVYIKSNIDGFYNVLECCKVNSIKNLIFASSSSIYGNNTKYPYCEEDKTDSQVSLYAATKKSNELLAYSYSKLYNLHITGLRFFTVYGPYGRPDMAYFSFTNKLLNNEKIKIFNYGNCQRDFTYVDDVVNGIRKIIEKGHIVQSNDEVPFAVYNIGNNHPENLLDFVNILEKELLSAGLLDKDYDFEAHKELVPMQKGDVPITYADTSKLERDYGYKPDTPLEEGLHKFVCWYKGFYK